MTIRRRGAPADFGAASPGATPQEAALQPAPDADLNAPLIAPASEPEAAAPLNPPPVGSQVATSSPRTPARRPGAAEAADAAPASWPIYLLALVISVLWALAPIAYAVGYRRSIAPLTEDVFAIGVFALLAIGPAVFVWGAAYMIQQGRKLAAESRRAKAMADEMLTPALAAAARSGHVVQGIREEIVRAGEAADQARETLLALRQALATETATLVDAAHTSVRSAQELAGTLGQERDGLGELSQTLDTQAARLVDAVAEQARAVAQATEAAEGRLRESRTALDETLETHTARIEGTLADQARVVTEAAQAAGQELREAEAALSQSLEGQAAKIAETIGQQARMVADAAEVAEGQLKEAEAALAARAADLVAAAGEAGDAARTAGEDLNRHIARLETAGSGVADQVRAVQDGLSDQRTALIGLAQALKGDHETFAVQAETHAATLSDFIAQARLSAAEMADRAAKGGETLKRLMADAAEQFRDLAETARAEREEFGQSTVQSLDAVSQAAAEQRAQLEAQTRAAIEALHKAAEETREAAARHAATAREQVDQLSEAAFMAGQKANEVFEKRLEEARALVEQSSKMVEEAGAATAKRLDEGAAAARATLTELGAMLGELESRAARLPAAARGQVEEVRGAVEHGIEALMDAARRTAEEAQSIDLAFQERVRRNFEMLSEAVRLMGTAAAAPPTPLAAASPPAPAAAPARPAMASFSAAYVPRARPAPPAPEPEPPPAAAAPELEEDDLDLEDLVEPAPKPAKRPAKEAKESKAETPLVQRLGLRPRLKLTPTATDEEFSQVFEAAGGPPAAQARGDAEALGWKDLLASIDGGSGETVDLERKLAGELHNMGVEPAKLLPKARVEEVAAAVQTGDAEGARKVVRRLAPAATRRIARRLMADDDLKWQVATFVRRYQALVDDAVVKDPAGLLMAELLSSEAGRIYLLLDAAAGDMV